MIYLGSEVAPLTWQVFQIGSVEKVRDVRQLDHVLPRDRETYLP